MHGTPTVAYRHAGGTQESVAAGVSGLLVDHQQEFTEALRLVLTDDALRARLGDGARMMSHSYTWQHAQHSFAAVIAAALEGEIIDAADPEDSHAR